jgi:hypothetical protein
MANQSAPKTSQTPSQAPSAPVADTGARIQGEGDYEAARRYDKNVKRFVESADIDKAAHDAAPESAAAAADMQAAEQAGRARAKLPEKKP